MKNNMKKKNNSSMAKKKFGKVTNKKTTGPSGNLKEVISDARTKVADVVGKLSQGFVKPMIKASEAGDRQGLSPSGIANIGGALVTGAGRVITKAAENILRPGQQTKLKDGVISGLLMKRRSDGSMAKLKDQSFMKRMKMMNEASPIEFGPKRKTTKKKLPVDPLDIGGKITKAADVADKEMKNLISNVKTISKTDVPRAVAGDVKKLLNKVSKFVKTSKSKKVKGFGK
tara:strand:- start:634 stop:1320 length:687 start_codon:yes stop_codon:yes gene_type:complete